MKAIQKELGEDSGSSSGEEIAHLEEPIAKAGMPAGTGSETETETETEAHARKELRRLQNMSDASGKYSMLRTYLEWMVELPWATPAETPIDLPAARQMLQADHFGLERVKQRIVEFLAVRKLNPQGRAPIFRFVGPPGVGKTSLGQSIARALQRPFVRVSLGGVHDEAEIRGHRRTYIGALPGNIVQGLRKAGVRGCVMMLDEVDKPDRAARIHAGRKAADRAVLPRASAARGQRPARRPVRTERGGTAGHHRRLHARSRRVPPRARW